MKRLHKVLHLQSFERRLLVKAALLLWATRLGLWLLPFRYLRRVLDVLTRTPIQSRYVKPPSRQSVVWAVETAGRYMPPATTCLTLSLTVQILFLRSGYPSMLHIGAVREDGGRFSAHAWVESGGEVVIGGHQLERYTPLATLERKPA